MSGTKRATMDRRTFVQATAGAATALGGVSGTLSAWRGFVRGATPRPTDGSDFNILVLGDSVAWGQALLPEQKYSTKVKQWIEAQLPGRVVNLAMCAHSGAVTPPVAADADDGWASLGGEVPRSYPSLLGQAGLAMPAFARNRVGPERVSPEKVHLVIMDGGINDVGVVTILDPTKGTGAIRDVTRQNCGDLMRTFLPTVMTQFPNARFAVTNYYQLVSQMSTPAEVAILVGALGLLPEVPAASLIGISSGVITAAVGGAAVAIAIGGPGLRDILAAQSLAFHEESTKGLRAAVDYANQVTRSARAVFVDVGFGPERAYATQSASGERSFLWNLFETDPVAEARWAQCQQAIASGRLPGAFDVTKCAVARIGHPNALGAQRYAERIIDALNTMLWEWRGQRLMHVCVDPLPSFEPGATSTMRVIAWDRETRMPVAGDVFVTTPDGSRSFRTNEPFTITFCPAAAAATEPRTARDTLLARLRPAATPQPCDVRQIQVAAPGYAPLWVDLTIGMTR